MLFAIGADENLLASIEVEEAWARDFFCPGCSGEVHRVSGHERDLGDTITYVSTHFRHNSDHVECDYPDGVERVPESDTHARMVIIGLERLRSLCENGSDDVASILPTYVESDFDTGTRSGGSRTKSIAGHYPDGYVEFAESDPVYGSGVVLEAQYKNHQKSIKSTTEDYQEAGFSVVWTRESDYGGEYGVELPDIYPSTMDYPFTDLYYEDRRSGDLWPGTEIDNALAGLPDEFTLRLLSDQPIASEAELCFQWDWSRYDRRSSDTLDLKMGPQPTTQGQRSQSKWERGRWPVRSSEVSDNFDCEGCGRKGTYHVTSVSAEYTYDLKLCAVCVERIADMVKALKETNQDDRSVIRDGLEHLPKVARREIDDLPNDEFLNYYAQYRGKVGEEIPRPPPKRRLP